MTIYTYIPFIIHNILNICIYIMYLIYYVHILIKYYSYLQYQISYIKFTYVYMNNIHIRILKLCRHIFSIYANLHHLHQYTKKCTLDFCPPTIGSPTRPKAPYRSQNASTTKAVIAFISQAPGRLKFQKRLLKSSRNHPGR